MKRAKGATLAEIMKATGWQPHTVRGAGQLVRQLVVQTPPRQRARGGDRVWGKFTYGNGDGYARGSWNDGHLILILSPTAAQVGGTCDPRKIVVVTAKGTATLLESYVLDLVNHSGYASMMRRTSPSPGPSIEYPYEAELKNCGQLFTYDLAFDTNSDKLNGVDWPILDVMAGLIKNDPVLKLQIAGHTDATGNPESNQNLSKRRAETVKKTLTERYGADASRISAKGYGAEQPLAANDTEEGKSINRRVEIVIERYPSSNIEAVRARMGRWP